MPYLIDGHNLVPKMGLRLDSLNDENELVERLNEFCRLSRKSKLEVYFDNAPAGQLKSRKIGLVTAYFIRKPLIADEAIRQRLKKLGKAARNWTVVSSDRWVQRESQALGATVVSSESFARTVQNTLHADLARSERHNSMSQGELEEWIQLFTRGKG